MPVVDGLAATMQIRSYEKSLELLPIPIIAATGLAQERDRAACELAGMNAVLTKPIRLAVLRQQLDMILRSKAFQQRQESILTRTGQIQSQPVSSYAMTVSEEAQPQSRHLLLEARP